LKQGTGAQEVFSLSTLQYRWGILGCGTIAREMAVALQHLGSRFGAVAARNRDHAAAFAREFGIPKVCATPEALLTDPSLDILYLATPNNTHYSYLTAALQAGKHVLCEKPVTLNARQWAEVRALASERHLQVAEAQTIYHMPLYRRLRERADKGLFGPLRLVQINFGSWKSADPSQRFFSRDLAGGALLDIGVYALSFARWFLSSKPERVQSQVKLAPTGVDEQSCLLLENAQQEMTSVTLSFRAKQPKRALLAYDKAYVEVSGYPRAEKAVITWTADGHREEVFVGSTELALAYEVLDMEEAVSGKADHLYVALTQDVMDIMTTFRQDWGLTYPGEGPLF
jgi:predicted dehydrogenase